MKKPNRREFLSAVAGLGVAVTPYFLSSAQAQKSPAPSDQLRLGMIACGDMGCRNARDFDALTELVSLCDVSQPAIDYAMNDPKIGKQGTAEAAKIDVHKDYRHILDRKDIDIVSIATPDHWHIKPAIEALQAGKHVFCEKPLTLTLEENQLIRNACKKYDKQVFQVGTRIRSSRHAAEFVAIAQRGLIGEIRKATATLGTGPMCPSLPAAPGPDSLDYDLWLGQAPAVPYRASTERTDFRERKSVWPRHSNVYYNFRWWLDYSGGKLTDWGAHYIDLALWALNRNAPGTGPVKIVPYDLKMPVPMKDGYPTELDRYNTPHKFRFDCIFEDGFVLTVQSHSPDKNGILLEGTKGRLHFNEGRIKGKPYEVDQVQEALSEEDIRNVRKGKALMSHKDFFMACIRDGGEPISDVNSHVQAMNVCHLCGISARLGREIEWDPKEEKLGDEQSQSFFARIPRKGFEIPRV